MTENPARTTEPSDVPSGVPHSVTRLVDHWGLVLAYGLVTIGFGLVLALWPDETLKVLAVLIGIQFIFTGVFRLVLAVASRSLDGGARAVTGLFGALAIVLGLLCLRSPLQTVLVIGMILGVWWLAAGLVDIVGALRSRGSHRRGWDLGLGVLSVLAGGFLLVNPEVSLGVLVIVVCLWLFSYGFIAVVAALVLRSEEKRTAASPLPGATRLAT
ncbi:MAG: HdeD family acid-resistance protein [Nocardioides sp.]